MWDKQWIPFEQSHLFHARGPEEHEKDRACLNEIRSSCHSADQESRRRPHVHGRRNAMVSDFKQPL